MSMMSALLEPSPKTVWVEFLQRSHARQFLETRRRSFAVASEGINSKIELGFCTRGSCLSRVLIECTAAEDLRIADSRKHPMRAFALPSEIDCSLPQLPDTASFRMFS